MWIACGAVLGLVAGSFLATLVVRWPAGRTLAGRSRCDSCGALLAVRDLVPLFSWLFAGGRARCCHAPLPAFCPLFELACAVIGASAFHVAPGLPGLAGAFLGWTLLALLALDLRHYWLPDRLTLPLLGLGLLLGNAPFLQRLAGAATGFAGLFLVAFFYQKWRQRAGIGRGDIKLTAALGAWLGVWALPSLLLVASLLGFAMAALLFWRRRNLSRTTTIPFGACLAAAGYPLWLLGVGHV